jgi:glycosyltransferase EpsF
LIKDVPSAMLVLVGDGSERAEIASKVARLGLNRSVVFTGVREDVNRLVSAFDVFLFPSFYEGLGLAVIEAQALGIPCVISDAIPPEVDIGLGLVEKLSLQQSTSTWIEAIRRRADRKQGIASEATADALRGSGYDISSVVATLYQVYAVSA